MVSSSWLATLEFGLLHTLRIRDCATTLILPTRKAAAPQRPMLSATEPKLTTCRVSVRYGASGILGQSVDNPYTPTVFTYRCLASKYLFRVVSRTNCRPNCGVLDGPAGYGCRVLGAATDLRCSVRLEFMQIRWSRLIALAVLVAACSPQSSIADNIEIPSDAIDCGTDSQIGPASTWTYSASTCVKTAVESGEAAWMITEFTGSDGETGQAVILLSADATMRRYAVAANGAVLQDDVCAKVDWIPVDQETTEYTFSGLLCRTATGS